MQTQSAKNQQMHFRTRMCCAYQKDNTWTLWSWISTSRQTHLYSKSRDYNIYSARSAWAGTSWFICWSWRHQPSSSHCHAARKLDTGLMSNTYGTGMQRVEDQNVIVTYVRILTYLWLANWLTRVLATILYRRWMDFFWRWRQTELWCMSRETFCST